MNEQLHPVFRELQFFPLRLFYLPQTTIDEIALFSKLYTYIAIQSFLVGSKHLKSRGKASQFLCFLALHMEELNLLLLIDCYCWIYYSFLIRQLTEKEFKKKACSEIKQQNHKMFFSKNNTPPKHSRQKLCVFSSPINERKIRLPQFSFCLRHVCVAWRFATVVAKKIK